MGVPEPDRPHLVGGGGATGGTCTVVRHAGDLRIGQTWLSSRLESSLKFRGRESAVLRGGYRGDDANPTIDHDRPSTAAIPEGSFSFDIDLSKFHRCHMLEYRLASTINAQTGLLHKVSISPNGKWLALAEADTVTLVDLCKYQVRHKIRCAVERVNDVIWTPDGRLLCTRGAEIAAIDINLVSLYLHCLKYIWVHECEGRSRRPDRDIWVPSQN